MPWGPWPDDITTSELVTAAWLTKVSQSLASLEEVAYVEFTANVSVTGTSFVDIVSAGAITYENVPHLFEFSCPRVTCGASGNLAIALRDASADLGWFAQLAANENERGFHVLRRLTPSAASHTYKVSAQNSASQTSSFVVGAGGAGTFFPGFLRILRIPT